LSIYHGIMLAWGPFSQVWLGNWMVLGYASAAVMGVSSVNGIAQKWMTARIGNRGWLWVHRASIILALIFVSVHAVMMGTDSAFLRDLFQPAAILAANL
jgi:hypothetical protein